MTNRLWINPPRSIELQRIRMARRHFLLAARAATGQDRELAAAKYALLDAEYRTFKNFPPPVDIAPMDTATLERMFLNSGGL